MRCEIIAIGTELLLGQIIDSNSSWMGGELALAGIDSHYQTKVGDNQVRMVECIRLALSRSDAVILCGGLGPTQDDITREAIADVMAVKLIRHDWIGEHIRKMFEQRGREMAPSNLRQADVPEGASTIKEMPGTAPGLICPIGDQVIYAVPGVPHEMKTMLEGSVLPDLKRRAGVTSVIKSRVLRSWGYSESGLADLLADQITALDQSGKATLAFQASGIEGIKVRITAKADDDGAVEAILSEVEQQLRPLLGDYIFGIDDQTMESVVLDLLAAKGQTLAIAETLTAGLATHRLAQIPTTTPVFLGGHTMGHAITAGHAMTTGHAMAGGDLLSHGPRSGASPVDVETAESMAVSVRELFGADVGVAAKEEGGELGAVKLAVATGDGVTSTEVKLPGDARRMQQYAVISLLNMLRLRLRGVL